MTMLSKASQIWKVSPSPEDFEAAAAYASVTLPWTFNRLMYTSTSNSLCTRALNIAKGVVAQKALLREFTKRGISAREEVKSYRSDDRYDFLVQINGAEKKLDVKSINYYTDYEQLGRQPLSRELIVANAGYPGPEWSHFFPMLMAHTQIAQPKEIYCFAIASSIDFRRKILTNRSGYAITAFPYGAYSAFLSNKKLILAREEARKGVFIKCEYKTNSLYGNDNLALTILGEWNGTFKKKVVTLQPDSLIAESGPFSGVASFQLEPQGYDLIRSHGRLEISVSRNDFVTSVRNSKKENVNIPPVGPLVISSGDFCNLIFPSDYTLYFMGWIAKEDYLKSCRKYPAWVWPKDSVNKLINQPWQLTGNDRKTLEGKGFDDCITGKPPRLEAGWMKASQGGGACCYVYPNMHGGGLRETNLYVLPQDLETMDTFNQ